MDSLLSDFDSESEGSSSEDQEDMESLFGQARTIFSSLEETIEKIDDFLLFERGFLHNDIVRLASDPSTPMGKVINVEMTVDVENLNGNRMKNVNTKDLQKIHSISVGDYVILGAWLGKVERTVDCVTVLFDDGTKSRLSAEGNEKIVPLSPDLVDDPRYPFYPGQRVKIESSSASSSTRWLCGIRKGGKEQGTVCEVDVEVVYVDWLCCALVGSEKTSAPSRLQNSNNLVLLPCFPHASWQLGDWCALPKPNFPNGLASQMVKDHKQSDNSQQIAVIGKTKTKVDVLWQDGSQSQGLDSHMLSPVNFADAHTFWPGTFVLEKGTFDDSQVPGFQKWGIVKSADPKELTVKVEWLSMDPSKHKEAQIEEIVSAYELVEHPDYSYCVGEAVFKMDKCIAELAGGNGMMDETISKVNVWDQNDNLKRKFLSHFGTVIGFNHGQIDVKWADGATSKVAPFEIYRVDSCESTDASVFGEENVQQPNEELPLKNSLPGQKLVSNSDLNCDNTTESSYRSISQAAVGLLSSVTLSLFGSLCTSLISGYQCTSEGMQGHSQSLDDEAVELCNLNFGEQIPPADDLDMPEKITPQKTEEANKDIAVSTCNKQSFRQFDMVNNCSDHHFVHQSGMDVQSPQMKRGWLKKVQQEWSILEKDLPETIYVRAYEERISLLRCAVVGTEGTPYHDGLFFFDIYLPPQYPSEPPMVYYNSGGLRLNPNLYESGKVCLSLLNTWSGSQTEVWNPGSSTILQVLLSIQALVLNEKPYFNEAGYDLQVGKAEGEMNSISYNENAFLVSCRSMLYLLRKPPKHFEALVDEHFNRRCRNILLACKAYMQGAPVGHPFVNRGIDELGTLKGGSTGFKIMLTKLYPKLVEAFSGKGFDCGDSSYQVP